MADAVITGSVSPSPKVYPSFATKTGVKGALVVGGRCNAMATLRDGVLTFVTTGPLRAEEGCEGAFCGNPVSVNFMDRPWSKDKPWCYALLVKGFDDGE